MYILNLFLTLFILSSFSVADDNCDLPDGLCQCPDVVAVAKGVNTSLLLHADGTVSAFGENNFGQADVPSGLNNVVQVEAGGKTSYALKSDGTVVAWGRDDFGEVSGASNLTDVIQIDANANGNSIIALKSDGSVVVWGGSTECIQCIPNNLPSNIVKVSMGTRTALALDSDGYIHSWGTDANGGWEGIPSEVQGNCVDVVAGKYHGVALTNSGDIYQWRTTNHTWGNPVPEQEDLSAPVQSVFAGQYFSGVLLEDNSVVVWTKSENPSVTWSGADLEDIAMVETGWNQSIVLKTDGSVRIWEGFSDNYHGTFPDDVNYLGCTNPDSDFYDILANCDDGSCLDIVVEGCIDTEACNYNADATDDDGSCSYPADSCTACDGSNLGGQDCAGVCNGDSVEDECGNCDNDSSNDCYLATEEYFNTATETFGLHNHLNIWLDGSSPHGLDSDGNTLDFNGSEIMSTWIDLSGSGNHLESFGDDVVTWTSDSFKNTISEQSGSPIVKLNAARMWNNNASFDISDKVTIYYVLERSDLIDPWNSTIFYIGEDGAGEDKSSIGHYNYGNGQGNNTSSWDMLLDEKVALWKAPGQNWDAYYTVAANSAQASEPNLYKLEFDDGTISLFRDGQMITTKTGANLSDYNFDNNFITIGDNGFNYDGSASHSDKRIDLNFAEMMVFNTVLTEEEDESISQYLLDKWGFLDCAGVFNGNAEVDDCGVCDGGNADQDCAGVCFGESVLDECGVCDGSGPTENFTCDGTFKPETKDALQAAVEMWIEDNSSALGTYGEINTWNTSLITDMSNLFMSWHGFYNNFNDDISNWDVSNVTNMYQMFYKASGFNQPLSNWDVSSVTNMQQMFDAATSFNQDLSDWDVSNVTTMNMMFLMAYNFNGDVSGWDVSSVTNMNQLFRHAHSFNKDVSNWDVSNVTTMIYTFSIAYDFNQDLSNWDVSNVTSMNGMFAQANDFNQDLSNWNVSNVTDMHGMFSNTAFNQDISSWDISSVTTMSSMFNNANDLSEANKCAIHTSFSTNENWPYDWTENIGCDGVCFSGLVDDECGVCDGDNSSCEDCAGVPNGNAVIDECGICAGDNSTCADWCGIPNGDNSCADITSCEIGEGEVIPYIPFSTTGNTTGLVKDFTNADEYFNSIGGDYVYELSLSEYSVLNISTCGAWEGGFDPVITFYQFDDDCNAVLIAGNDDYSGSGFNYNDGLGITDEEFGCAASTYSYDSALFGLGLEAGDYMLVVSGYEQAEGQFPLTIEYADEDRVASTFPSYDEFINEMRTKAYENNDDIALDFPENISFEVTSSNQRDECNFVIGPDAGCDGVCFSDLDLDCAGECGGSTTVDDCGVCDGGNADQDCSGVCFGDLDLDCAGECGGSAMVDDCGVCDGGNADQDCAGVCFGESVLDECGECGGSGPDQHFTCSGFKPETKDALQAAVDLWVSSPESTEVTYGHISDWDVSLITNMSSLFQNKTTFNDDISSWDVSNVNTMRNMFSGARAFNGDISSWDVSNVTDMHGMLHLTDNFNQDLNSWDVSNVNTMKYMFYQARAFNGDISSWDVSNVTDMNEMFSEANEFNGDISNWDVSSVTDMFGMFYGCWSFNQDISSWNVSNVLYMGWMFISCHEFNSDISSWDVSNVTNMEHMFGHGSGYYMAGFSDATYCSIHTSFSTNENWPYDWSENVGCDGVCFSGLVDDECGDCGGDNSSCEDCAGIPNGTHWESDCGCVAADNSGDDCDDCLGVPNGTHWESDCGCVAADNSGDDCDDCAGVPNGDAQMAEYWIDNDGDGLGFDGGTDGYCLEASNCDPSDQGFYCNESYDGYQALNHEYCENNSGTFEYMQSFIPNVHGDWHCHLNSGYIRGLQQQSDADTMNEMFGTSFVKKWGGSTNHPEQNGSNYVISPIESCESDAQALNDCTAFINNDVSQDDCESNGGTWLEGEGGGSQMFCDALVDAGWVSNSDDLDDDCYSNEYDCAEECTDTGSAVFDECGVCDGDNSSCADCFGIPNGSGLEDECGVCDGNSSSYAYFDILNIVTLVDAILEDSWSSDNLYCSDVDNSGSLSIVDVIMMVESILGSARLVDASEVILTKDSNLLSYNADGFVGGLQITLSHGDNFDINLTANAMVADYKTTGSLTTIIIAAPESGSLFTASSEFFIEEVIAGTSAGEIMVTMPVDFGLSAAYPNPFNPSTSFNLNMSSTEMVSIDVYNVMGQRVDTIHNGELAAGVHSFSWNGAEIASGSYFIRATTASNIATQKVMLIK